MRPFMSCRGFAPPGFLYLLLMLPGMYVHSQPLGNNHFAVLHLNEVNAHAARHFLNNFSQASDVKWFLDEQHFIATCKEADSTDKVYYKTNGNFDFCIKYYQADALEPSLKSAVLRKFTGCEILTVTELTDLERRELFIKIKDGVYIRTLTCSGAGIEITENITDGS